MRVEVLDGAHDSAHEFRGVLLEEVRLCADAVKQLAALAQVRHEVDWRVRKVSGIEYAGRGSGRTVILRLSNVTRQRGKRSVHVQEADWSAQIQLNEPRSSLYNVMSQLEILCLYG